MAEQPGLPTMSRVTRTRKEAQASYDRLSRWYDLFARSEVVYNRRGLEMLGVLEGETVLEIGFGTGQILLALAGQVGAGGRVVGIDLSYGMAREARERLQKCGPDASHSARTLFSLGDATRLPYPPAYFDAVFTAFTLELFDTPEIPCVLQEIYRVLRSNGRIGVVALSLPERPGKMVRLYEWFHRALPDWVDCRPIPVEALVRQNGFAVQQAVGGSMWGLPVEMVCGVKDSSFNSHLV